MSPPSWPSSASGTGQGPSSWPTTPDSGRRLMGDGPRGPDSYRDLGLANPHGDAGVVGHEAGSIEPEPTGKIESRSVVAIMRRRVARGQSRVPLLQPLHGQVRSSDVCGRDGRLLAAFEGQSVNGQSIGHDR